MIIPKNIGIYCLGLERSTSRAKCNEYRGLARSSVLRFLDIIEYEQVHQVLAKKEGFPRVWKAYDSWLSFGNDLSPLPSSDEFLLELMEFLKQLPWNQMSVELRWNFEFLLAIECTLEESSKDAMRHGQLYCSTFPTIAAAQLQWLGFDLNESVYAWSAAANIAEWKGPEELLNAHGLCEEIDEISKLRDLYLRSDDEFRAPPEDYHVFGVMKIPFDIQPSA